MQSWNAVLWPSKTPEKHPKKEAPRAPTDMLPKPSDIRVRLGQVAHRLLDLPLRLTRFRRNRSKTAGDGGWR